MTFADVMGESLGDLPRVRPSFTDREALLALSQEADIVAMEAGRLANGIGAVDVDRLFLCVARIRNALEFIRG
jgi:hypothetical protein